jgi:anti-sigma regulatory factor (Ser/Thr protein kinase)
MAQSEQRAPGHEQTEFPRRSRIPYRKMRDRRRLAEPPRRPNGPPPAAGGAKRRRRAIFDVAISLAGLGSLRTRVASWMNKLGAGPSGDDVVLVVHELATNVVRHGGGSGRVRMWRERGRIVCRVSDSGPGMPLGLAQAAQAKAEAGAEPEVRRPGGRGLWIARRLADVRIETGPSGTVVQAALAL